MLLLCVRMLGDLKRIRRYIAKILFLSEYCVMKKPLVRSFEPHVEENHTELLKYN